MVFKADLNVFEDHEGALGGGSLQQAKEETVVHFIVSLATIFEHWSKHH